VVSRGMDNLKKARGENTSTVGSLRMKTGGHDGESAAPPLLKIK